MESATNSWGETNMMALTERTLDVRRNAADDRRLQNLGGGAAGKGNQKLPSTRGESEETIQSVKEELIAVRREHAKLQQAIYEAAQVQRKLCAPRELVWGEFEIAGEIFPVRHLSGGFFKVMQLGSVLGLVVGDIAGKGLSASISQSPLLGLVRISDRRNPDIDNSGAAGNYVLCLA